MEQTRELPRLLDGEYATYREEVRAELLSRIPAGARVVVDPMAGTASLMPPLQLRGHEVHMLDISPVHYYVNSVRTAEACRYFHSRGENAMVDAAIGCLGDLTVVLRRLAVADGWFDAPTLGALQTAWELTPDLGPRMGAFVRALIVMLARDVSCHQGSTNPTWVKPGGLRRAQVIDQLVKNTVDRLSGYYQAAYDGQPPTGHGPAEVAIEDALNFRLPRKADVIVTSPPYCNRLEHSQMWGPELALLSALGEESSPIEYVGATRVRGYDAWQEHKATVSDASPVLARFLDHVYQEEPKRDSHYYSKYFTQYFHMLFRFCQHAPTQLKQRGRFLMVVQDNAHRGERIHLADIVSEFLAVAGLAGETARNWDRHHLGLKTTSRRHSGVYPKHPETVLVAKKC